jgi:hypothetical protein
MSTAAIRQSWICVATVTLVIIYSAHRSIGEAEELPSSAEGMRISLREDGGPEREGTECPHAFNRTLEDLPRAFSRQEFCAQFNEKARIVLPKLVYGVMFSYELDMLELLLHETFPVVDHYLLVESSISHSLKPKALNFDRVIREERFAPFLRKIKNYTFNIHDTSKIAKYRSGWEIERRQRRRVLQAALAYPFRDRDIFVANLDIDEVFSREALMRYKYCYTKLAFTAFPFYYNVNCLTNPVAMRMYTTLISWRQRAARGGFYDLYRARQGFGIIPVNTSALRDEFHRHRGNVVWHFSTFGTVEQIIKKLSNSPHRFINTIGHDEVRRNMANCFYNNATRNKVKVFREMLPLLMKKNICHYRKIGWVRSVEDEGD